MSQLVQPDRQRGVVSIDQIIRGVLMDIGAGMERYEQIKHWILEAYVDFNFDMAQEIKTVKLPLTAWRAAEWPVDYVDFVMIGVEIDNKIQCFTNDERISLFREDADEDGVIDDLTAPAELPVGSAPNDRLWFWSQINSNGEYKGGMYGLTVKSNGVGEFKMNRERREIQFSPFVDGSTEIYLEYISNGYNPTTSTVVNVYAAKLLKLYAHWMRLNYSVSATIAQKEEAKRMYYTEYGKVQNRLNPITVADVLECARDGYRLISSF
jgi:hypothetical protein